MDWLESICLGIIQGLTEFLPISSTGHLYLGRQLFGLRESGLIVDTMLHLGTLLAVLLYYRQEIMRLIKQPFTKLSALLVVGTIPAVLFAFLLKDLLEELSDSGITIGWEFLVTGILLLLADRMRSKGTRELSDMNLKDALIIGFAQGAAIFPALSRSGLTVTAAIFRGFTSSTAAYFSFFLSIPAIAGAVLFQGKELYSSGVIESIPLSSILLASFSSFIAGYAAIRWMIRLLQDGSLRGFAYYVLALGGIVLIIQHLV
ncbi:undecaprenyl-diphosphate phosphatase [Risungbinella massiliensis]|uniref:undecaprenyl-diphosphate phosphatase n=1 Tax=Risungbinella massiliensis TaxID=1329796 RepID=UPI0005CC34E7|nr:undecaprenyl-diphosphate phosphatase [Risungbinella massiliensis]